MKKILEIVKWLTKVWNSFWIYQYQTNKSDIEPYNAPFQINFIEDIPESMPDKTIFIVQDGNVPELLAFKCPCGCDENVILNLLEDTSPRWSYLINGRNLIDIRPSVWRKVGCKSHFFVINSIIKWV